MGVLTVVALAGCGKVIGVRDIFLDEMGSTDADGGVPGTPFDGAIPFGADAAAMDAADCNADLKTDAKNCGSCGHDCLGGACTAGKCAPFKMITLGQPFAI